jgi:tripartite-type tricarboxylate transporter receptor subunit TctC
MQCRRNWLFGLCCAAPLLIATPGLAETVKIVVPFAAGGPVDQVARIVASELGPKLGADVIVDAARSPPSTSRTRSLTATRCCW